MTMLATRAEVVERLRISRRTLELLAFLARLGAQKRPKRRSDGHGVRQREQLWPSRHRRTACCAQDTRRRDSLP